MGKLYLIRHGQASFGAANYDELSDLGRQQARRLGAYWRARLGKALRFDAVLTGTLQRQIHTWDEIAAGSGMDGVQPERWPGLNEYDGTAVLRAYDPNHDFTVGSEEQRRHHFRTLRKALAAWMRGDTQPENMPAYADFVRGVVVVLDYVRARADGNVAVVSSGGPITTAVGHVLSVPAETTIEMNLFYRNTAVSELRVAPRRIHLVTYNTLPHLDAAPYRDWVTFA